MKFTMTITGRTPLLMHKDNLDWQDRMKEWISDPDNKKKSVPGDDRTPGFTWIGSMYEADGKVVLENDMLFKCLVNAGAKVIKKGNTSYKGSVASGVFLDELTFPLLIAKKEVQVGNLIKRLAEEMDYKKHCEEVAKLGFSLFAKRAAVNGSKHVRVRPRFEEWACVVSGEVDEDELPKTMFEKIVGIAGTRIGVGDWRPSAKQSPGPYGMFSTEVKYGK